MESKVTENGPKIVDLLDLVLWEEKMDWKMECVISTHKYFWILWLPSAGFYSKDGSLEHTRKEGKTLKNGDGFFLLFYLSLYSSIILLIPISHHFSHMEFSTSKCRRFAISGVSKYVFNRSQWHLGEEGCPGPLRAGGKSSSGPADTANRSAWLVYTCSDLAKAGQCFMLLLAKPLT